MAGESYCIKGGYFPARGQIYGRCAWLFRAPLEVRVDQDLSQARIQKPYVRSEHSPALWRALRQIFALDITRDTGRPAWLGGCEDISDELRNSWSQFGPWMLTAIFAELRMSSARYKRLAMHKRPLLLQTHCYYCDYTLRANDRCSSLPSGDFYTGHLESLVSSSR